MLLARRIRFFHRVISGKANGPNTITLRKLNHGDHMLMLQHRQPCRIIVNWWDLVDEIEPNTQGKTCLLLLHCYHMLRCLLGNSQVEALPYQFIQELLPFSITMCHLLRRVKAKVLSSILIARGMSYCQSMLLYISWIADLLLQNMTWAIYL